MEITRPACLEINLKNLQYNIEQIQKKIGENVKIMPVIKASGYGTYIDQRLDILNQFDIVNTTTNSKKSQEVERYSLEEIKQIYDYDIMIIE